MGRIRSTLKTDQVSTAHALPPDVEATLCNWGCWAAGREGRVQRRVSGPFRRAGFGLAWQGASARPGTVDVDSAWRVEQTICDPVFSPRFRTLLVEHYAHQRHQRDTCRLLVIAWAAYEAELFKAAMYCKDRLGRKFPQTFPGKPVDAG